MKKKGYLSLEYFEKLKPTYIERGFPIPKWIQFCEAMINNGWKVSLYSSHTTVSKYITVWKDKEKYKVRFSTHKPNKQKQDMNDADFYVGISHNNVMTTDELIKKLTEVKSI